jgi:hypothetical protein
MLKKIVWIAVIGVVLLVVALVLLLGNLDRIVKGVVESVGSESTGTDVTLRSVDVSLTDGRASMEGLTVANPEGFATKYAVQLGKIAVKIDTASIGKDVVVIEDVTIDGPAVIYEWGGGGSNIAVIQRNVDAYAGGGGGSKGGGSKGGDDAAAKGEGTRVVINTLTIQGGQVDVAATFLGDRKVGAKLPQVVLRDIGKKSGGATAAEVAEQILDAILGNATKTVDGLGIDGLKKQAEGVLDGAKKGLDDAKKGLGGLLGK